MPVVVEQVSVADARAWATYVRSLRAEIAERKQDGELPADLAAPGSIYRTLLVVFEAIDALPEDAEYADLELSEGRNLAVFGHYLNALMSWIDFRVEAGLLRTVRPPEADRFVDTLLAHARSVG